MNDETINNANNISGWKRLTDNAKKVVIYAHELAEKYRNPEVSVIHVFQSLVQHPTPLVARIFEELSLDVERTQNLILAEIERRSKAEISKPKFSEGLKKLINTSFFVAERLSHVYVGSEHLLLAILELDGEDFIRELKQLGMNPEAVGKIVNQFGTYPQSMMTEAMGLEGLLDDIGENEDSLPFFSKDMNQAATDGEYLNITGRDNEIDRVIHILSRKTKNNPILVGDAGVGKTAIAEGLVQRINRGDVPPSFIDKKVVGLDVPAIVAGARIRGDIEERILGLVRDAIESGDKIIFIDEIHMIVGAGSFGGRDAMDIGNILKPYLTDPRLRIIGATTVTEFRRFFDDDPALSRRFQPIEVEEISKESAIKILGNLAPEFEEYHGVKIKPKAISEAVELSSRFITDRYLPDKAIDVIDEAAASLKIGREILIEPHLSELGEKLLKTQKSKQAAIEKDDMKKAAKYRQEEDELLSKISDLVEGRHSIGGHRKRTVTAELIRDVVVQWTKIPLAGSTFDTSKLEHLDKQIKGKIFGQDQVLEPVLGALKRSHLGLNSPNRPLASFLFLGPTGVGKTQLAKTIASEVFGSNDLLIQINMSEYMEMHSVAKLIGSPPGYVGYQEGGQLTEQVRRRPYSVVLFDEIEKGHPEVLNILLQVLEEGELNDGKGRKANFRNTIVIMTSNIGAEEISRDDKLGFNIMLEGVDAPEIDSAYIEMKKSLEKSLKQKIRPELLNRIDEIAIFRGLNEEDCLEISNLLLDELVLRLLESGISLELSSNVAKHINKHGYDKEYGARNIRRTIQEQVEDGLAKFILDEKLRRPNKGMMRVKVKAKQEKLIFSKVK